MNGADILCDTLLANDIDVCFANPGTSEMHFVAALDRRPKMRCVLGLFEGVVTGTADGYARMADKPAATLLHLGPGLANGIANLHNARRAHTPMVNIVGDHATHHLKYDAPLTSDIESLARPVSHWIGRAASAELVAERTREAIAAAHQVPGQIATLILHADAAWSPAGDTTPRRVAGPIVKAPDPGKVEAAAKALKAGKPTTIIAGGLALREAQSALLDRIAAATNTRLIAQQANGRMARGAGRPALERVPYVIEQALALFEKTEQVILVGAREPVAFFAYPGKPSHILPEECAIFDLTGPGEDMGSAIEALAETVGIGHLPEARVMQRHRPDAPSGALTAEAIALAVARHMPENAIICDESITSGRNFFSHTHGAQPHDLLQLTGGAIGIGPPLATGAAIACPDRKVIALQADGSGMYTVQALWTQAREALDIVTIIFANRRYQILRGELQNVGAGAPGENARRMLDLDSPELDWVKMAAGMGVEGARADTAEAFDDLLASACKRKGPFLIEAVI